MFFNIIFMLLGFIIGVTATSISIVSKPTDNELEESCDKAYDKGYNIGYARGYFDAGVDHMYEELEEELRQRGESNEYSPDDT